MSEMWEELKAKANALRESRPVVFYAMVIALVVVLMAVVTYLT